MTTWDLQEKAGTTGLGWLYNEANLTYNQLIDPDSGNAVFYNAIGQTTTWTLEIKS